MKSMDYIYKLKNNLSVWGLLIAVLIFASCDDQLKEKPENFYSTDNYFTNVDRLKMSVNGIYEVFSLQETYGQYWMVYDCDTDISFIKGSVFGHVARDLGHYNVYVDHSWLQSTWGAYYEGIDRANTVLENIDQVELKNEEDKKVLDQLVAEAHCLRAMAYFDLVLLWGDVPLKTQSSKADHDFNMVRTDRNLVFDQIESDYKKAIEGLEYAVDQKGDFVGRLNKGAAIGLLARMNLFRAGYFLSQEGKIERYPNYKEYYQNVISLTDELIASNKHSLLPSYETVFKNMCELKRDYTENIWEIPFYNAVGGKLHTSNMGTYNGPVISQNSSYGRANSFIKTIHFFQDTFEDGDLRRDVAVSDFQILGNDEVQYYPKSKSIDWSPGKWRRNWQTGQIKDNNNTDVNWLLLRYADILLMRAESENEVNGVTSVAVEYLNQVRRRAFGFDYKTPTPIVDKSINDFASSDDFRKEIVDERGRELCFEGLRRQDLIRWNILNDKLQETKMKVEKAVLDGELDLFLFVAADKFTPNKHELFPIPAYEVRETKGAITQNPNYQQ